MASLSLLVIGAGPGGNAAALYGAQRGFAVTLIDERELGGTCLNRGCIPSKFLLSHAKQFADALKLSRVGIDLRLESLRLPELLQQKNTVLDTLRQRMEQAVKAARVRYLHGRARFTGPQEIEVAGEAGTERISADRIILATGSNPVIPQNFPSHPAIFNSTSIFELNYLPSHLVVLGGGYIGCELACAFQGLGSKVTIIEKESRLLATQPEFEAAAGVLARSFEKRGISVWTRTQLESVTPVDAQRLRLTCSNGETLEANALLLALGRNPNLEDLGLEQAGLKLENGRLPVNPFLQTGVPHIYALGDVVTPLPLAHTASREAQSVIAHIAGESAPIDYSAIPRCIYTWPEAAAVGLSEAQARQGARAVRVDRYHFAASAKAMVEGDTEGFWVIVSDEPSGKILGAQVVGGHATELIHLIALALKAGQTIEDVAQTVFAHPTLAEGFHELAERSVQQKKLPSRRFS